LTRTTCTAHKFYESSCWHEWFRFLIQKAKTVCFLFCFRSTTLVSPYVPNTQHRSSISYRLSDVNKKTSQIKLRAWNYGWGSVA